MDTVVLRPGNHRLEVGTVHRLVVVRRVVVGTPEVCLKQRRRKKKYINLKR